MTSDETALSIEAARRHYLATLASRADLAHLLFPVSGRVFDERTQSQVRMKLFETIFSIEKALAGTNASSVVNSRFWEPLAEIGGLRDPELVEFAWARSIETDLQASLSGPDSSGDLQQLPASMLASPDKQIAGIARALLIATHATRPASEDVWREMSPELLCRLLQMLTDTSVDGVDQSKFVAIRNACDEGGSVRGLARKLLFCLDETDRRDARIPARAGLPVFVASLEDATAIAYDRILLLIGNAVNEPFLLLLRAAGFDRDDAKLAVRQLYPASSNDAGFDALWSRIGGVSVSNARDMIADWTNEEARA